MIRLHLYSFFVPPVVAVLLLSGCGAAISTNNTPSPKSKIIEQVEAAGSGPVNSVSTAALYGWFQDRMDFTLVINKQCKDIRPKAPAGWSDTPEGRVCEVAKELAVFRGQ